MNTQSIKENVRYLIVAALLALGLMTAVVATMQHNELSVGATHLIDHMAGPDDDHGGG